VAGYAALAALNPRRCLSSIPPEPVWIFGTKSPPRSRGGATGLARAHRQPAHRVPCGSGKAGRPQRAVCRVSTIRPSAVRGPRCCGPRCHYAANAGGTPNIESARHALSSYRNRTPKLAPQIRTAFANMASKTGSSSPGEVEMICNTSEVAVCCSRPSVSSSVRYCTSSNSRTFSIAITVWSAKVVTSSAYR
jgi:hypothetical protein